MTRIIFKGSRDVNRIDSVVLIGESQIRAGDVLQMIVNGELKIQIHQRYPLAEAQQAYRDLEGRKTTGKLLLIP